LSSQGENYVNIENYTSHVGFLVANWR
jgi:hypothetical protein